MKRLVVGVCLLVLALGLAGGVQANEFYDAGTADEIAGADNLGKTIVHYLVVLGLPLLSGGLIGGGLMRVRQNPGQGGASIGAGVGAGYLAAIVGDLHSDAAAAVSLVGLAGGVTWLEMGFGLALQAALAASVACYRRGRFTCGSAAGASLTNR